MTCETPCDKCKCQKPCDTLPIDEDLYVEIDDTSFTPPSEYY